MRETFQEKVLNSYRRFVRKHPKMRFPAMLWSVTILSAAGFFAHIEGNAKRYICIAFTLMIFLFSCSFTSSVFPGSTEGFIAKASNYDAMVGKSDAELADPVTAKTDMPDSETETDEYDPDGIDENGISQIDKVTLDDILKDSGELAVTESEAQAESTEEESEETSDASFSSSDWKLTLVNKQHPIPDNYEFQLGTIHGNMRCDERVLGDLLSMFKAAREDGVNLVLCSPYRDMSRQKMLFNRKIQVLMKNGVTYIDAYKETSQAVTVPGASEHQIGLAFDIVSDSYSVLDAGFENTPEGRWLADNSYKFGFILRYPKGKENITGIEYEPWHYRYVGKKAAALMYEQGITLEEFWDKYL